MSFITSIGTAVPVNRFSQVEICDFMIKAMQADEGASRKLRAIFRASGIETRYSVLDDYGKQSDFSFYSNTLDFEPFPSTEKRMMEFRRHALPLSEKAIERCLALHKRILASDITHLVVVSCTGMYAPGLDIDIVQSLKLPVHVQRTAIHFMGCYAAFNAIKVGDAICKANTQAKVLIVCTEICSIHFQKEITEDNLIANSIFADGSAAILMEAKPANGWNLSPSIFHNALSFSQQEHMAWNIGSFGFEMKLSSYVPEIIESQIRPLTSAMLKTCGASIQEMTYVATHPGGRKILEAIEKALSVTREQNQFAHEILRQYGNMSSATILFVLEAILSNVKPTDINAQVLSFAFGPGLTLESILFKLYHADHA